EAAKDRFGQRDACTGIRHARSIRKRCAAIWGRSRHTARWLTQPVVLEGAGLSVGVGLSVGDGDGVEPASVEPVSALDVSVESLASGPCALTWRAVSVPSAAREPFALRPSPA